MLSARGLRKRYKSREVVHDFGLDLGPGEVVGLLGPNGAGKTTCFYMIVGLVPTDAGRIELDGEDITGLPMHERARRGIGYLPQEASVFRKLSVADNLLAVLELRSDLDAETRKATLASLLEELQVAHVAGQTGRQPVRRRAPARGDRARAGGQSAPDPARRALRRRRPDFGRRDPEDRPPPRSNAASAC